MQHSRALADEVGGESQREEQAQQERVSLNTSDRSFPPWAATLGALFTIAQQVCFYATIILGVVIVNTVAQQGEISMVPILTAVGAAFMACLIVVNFAHNRALAGYRKQREAFSRKTSAAFAVVIFLTLSIINPIAGLPIFLGVSIGSLGHFVLSKRKKNEPLWEILPAEAVSLMSGRDFAGLRLAATVPANHAMARSINLASLGVTLTLAFGIGSYLIAENIITDIALFPLLIASFWSVENAMRFATEFFATKDPIVERSAEVLGAGHPPEEESYGLSVKNLTVIDTEGSARLSNLNFNAPPGTITGIVGETGAGKSILLNALADPFSLSGMEVSGQVLSNGHDLWLRSAQAREPSVAFLPDSPILLPASGEVNLSCMNSDEALARGKSLLERLVYSSELVEAICATPDATHLPRSQAQALSFARAFLIGPDIYLLDRPEDGLTEKQIGSVVDRLKQEVKLGRNVVMATDNRVLLETCDRLVVMQYGRIIDQGPAELVRERISTGWSRFIGTRLLETEENLLRWVHSHFRRGSEEANKRRVGIVASDMLTYSCKTSDPSDPGVITFTFKHFEGHCVLRMEDQDNPISSAQFERARQAAKETTIAKDILPLASIFQSSLEVEKDSRQDNRVLEVKIKTFDPRKVKTGSDDGADSSS